MVVLTATPTVTHALTVASLAFFQPPDHSVGAPL